MVPSLGASEADASHWLAFVEEIKLDFREDPRVVVTPQVIEFNVGERPSLPMEGQKFLRFSARVSGAKSKAVEPYIRKAHDIARKHFGTRARFWHEAFDGSGHYDEGEVEKSIRSYRTSAPVSTTSESNCSQKLVAAKDPRQDAVSNRMNGGKKSESTDTKTSTLADLLADNQFCKPQPLPGKGFGLVAKRKIHKGSRILAEVPLLTYPKDGPNDTVSLIIAMKLKRLSKEEQRAFFALHNCHGSSLSPFLGTARTNGMPLGSAADEGGVFLVSARLNHACVPNCQHTFNVKRGEMTIHAVRDVAEGEELTICYTETQPSAGRRALTKKHFGFECVCEVCSLPAAELRLSDARHAEMRALDHRIDNVESIVRQPDEYLQWARALVRLLEAEGIADARLAKAYHDACVITAAHADQARARIFAERARATTEWCAGADNENTIFMGETAVDPTGHPTFGLAWTWAQGVDQVPKELGQEDFEKWLWREKT